MLGRAAGDAPADEAVFADPIRHRRLNDDVPPSPLGVQQAAREPDRLVLLLVLHEHGCLARTRRSPSRGRDPWRATTTPRPSRVPFDEHPQIQIAHARGHSVHRQQPLLGQELRQAGVVARRRVSPPHDFVEQRLRRRRREQARPLRRIQDGGVHEAVADVLRLLQGGQQSIGPRRSGRRRTRPVGTYSPCTSGGTRSSPG